MNAVTTKFVRTSTNKVKCPVFVVRVSILLDVFWKSWSWVNLYIHLTGQRKLNYFKCISGINIGALLINLLKYLVTYPLYPHFVRYCFWIVLHVTFCIEFSEQALDLYCSRSQTCFWIGMLLFRKCISGLTKTVWC